MLISMHLQLYNSILHTTVDIQPLVSHFVFACLLFSICLKNEFQGHAMHCLFTRAFYGAPKMAVVLQCICRSECFAIKSTVGWVIMSDS